MWQSLGDTILFISQYAGGLEYVLELPIANILLLTGPCNRMEARRKHDSLDALVMSSLVPYSKEMGKAVTEQLKYLQRLMNSSDGNLDKPKSGVDLINDFGKEL